MIAEAIDASEHGSFNQAIFSSVAFLVTSVTLDQPILALFFLLKVAHHPPSFLQVSKLLSFLLSCVLRRVLLESFLEIKLTNELVSTTAQDFIAQECTVTRLFASSPLHCLLNLQQPFLLPFPIRLVLDHILHFCSLDLEASRELARLPLLVHVYLKRLIV